MNLNNLFNHSRFQKYSEYLKSQGLSDSSISRKLSSLSTFQKYLIKKKLISDIPVPVRADPYIRPPVSPEIPKSNLPFLRYLFITLLFLLFSGLGYGLYTQIILKATKNLAYSTATNPIRAGRVLSFQGRLTDSSGNPITSSTNILFELYTAGTGGTQLYTSSVGNSGSIVPDENGIFSVVIGKTHGTEIPSNVFSENPEVWLQIISAGETMTPRQQIATVGYALNSETLQGLPPSASGLKNTVLVIDSLGNLNLGETSPTIISNSGTFGIIGQALLIGTSDGSGGNITINPDANGILKIITEGAGTTANGGQVELTNTNLFAGNLIGGIINNDNRGYNFIEFRNYDSSTTSLSTRFSVDAYGNIFGNSLSVGSTTLSVNLNADLLDGYHYNNLPYTNYQAWIANVGTSNNSINSGTTLSYAAGAGLSISMVGNTITFTNTGVGTTYSFLNGLTNATNIVGLGGTLNQNTNINLASYGLSFLGLGNTQSLFLSSNGNVGIGTTSPSTKLEVTGQISVPLGSGSTPSYSFSGDLNTGIFSPAADNIGFAVNANERFRINGGYFASSNAAGIIAGGAYIARDAGTSTTPTYSFGNDTDTGIFTPSANNIALSTAGNERFRIDASGNVGIGTTNPLYKLQVTGDALISTRLGIGSTNSLYALNVGGSVYASNYNSSTLDKYTASNANNTLINPVYGTAGNFIAYSPVPKYLWHDRLAFSKAWGAPTFETYDAGTTTWGSSAVDLSLFAQKENQNATVIDGTTKTAARWTWNNGSIGYSATEWWVIGVTWTAVASNKNYLLESSADGITWNTRHTTTGNTANYSPVWLKTSDNYGDTYYRLTITVTNAQPLKLSSLKALSARWGDQGGGSEQESPYLWDASQNIGFGSSAVVANGIVTIGSNTTSASGGLYFGTDSNLYRSAANQLKTDDSLVIGGTFISVGSTNLVTNLNAQYLNGYSYNNLPYDNYSNWRLQTNGAGTTNINSNALVNFVSGTGTSLVQLGSTITINSTGTTYVATNGLNLTNGAFGLGGTLTQNTNINLASYGLSFLGLGNTQSLFLSSNGNVGIGTTNPTAKLDVAGNLFLGIGSTFSNLAGWDRVIDSYGSNHSRITSRTSTTETSLLSHNSGWAGAPAGGVVGTQTTNAFSLMTGGNVKMTILNSGNVGIGTTNPNYLLQIQEKVSGGTGNLLSGLNENSGTAFNFSTDANNHINFTLNSATSTSHAFNSYWSSYINPSSFNTNGGLSIGYTGLSTGFGLYVASSGTGAAYFGGNVGIGTTNPLAKFTVVGNALNGSEATYPGIIQIQSGGGIIGSAGGLEFKAATSGSGYGFRISNPDLGTGQTPLLFQSRSNSASWTDNMTILATNGFVGIGTTSPKYKFEVNGDALISTRLGIGSTNILYALNVGGTAYFGNIATGSTSLVTNLNADLLDGYHANNLPFQSPLSFSNGILNIGNTVGLGGSLSVGTSINLNSNNLSFFGTGSVGIGTTNPSDKLSIVGGAVSIQAFGGTSNDKMIKFINGAGAERMSVGYDSTSVGFIINNRSSVPLSYLSELTGNFGIGTTNPKYKFEVNGDALISTRLGIGGTDSNFSFHTTSNGRFDTNLSVGGTLTLSQGAQNNYILTSDASGNAFWSYNSAVGTTYGATNGLNLSANKIFGLGGTLTQNTTIGTSSFGLSFLGLGNTQSLFLSSNGNVGVGTTNPTSKVDVVGNGNFTGQLVASSFLIDAANAWNSVRTIFGGKVGIGSTSTSQFNVTGDASVSTNFIVGNAFTSVGSTAMTTNLNADLLDGYHLSDFPINLQAGVGIGISGTSIGATIVNTGVISLTGAPNQINVSSSTGNIILTLPQDIGPSSTPTFNSLNIGSSAMITNLNADLLDGYHASQLLYGSWNLQTNGSGTTAINANATVNFVGGTGVNLAQNGSTITINSDAAAFSATNGLSFLDPSTLGLGGTLTQNTFIGTSSFSLSFLGLGNSQSLFLSNNGNVGVGFTAPFTKTTTMGSESNISVNRIVSISDTGTTIVSAVGSTFSTDDIGKVILWNDGTPRTIIGTNVTSPNFAFIDSSFGTGTTQSATLYVANFYISNAGKVGVGTADPTSLFQVNGVMSASKYTGLYGNSRYFFDPANTTSFNSSLALHGNGSITFNAETVNGVPSTILSTASTRLKSFADGFGIGTNIGSTGVGSTIIWNESFFVKNNGNVGIGTSNPQARLHIAAANSIITNTAGDITINAASGSLSLSSNQLINFSRTIAGSGSPLAPAYSFSSSTATGIYSPNNDMLSIATSGVDRLTIDNNGLTTINSYFNVTPDGYVNIGTGSTNSLAALSVIASGTTPGLNIGVSGSSSALFINSTGNVGIGTTSPTQKLHVEGQGFFADSSASYDPGGAAGPGVRIGYNTAGDYGYLFANDTGVTTKSLYLGGNLSDGIFIGGGKVGIGTTSPINKLHIEGTGGGSAGIYMNSAVPSSTANTLYNNGGVLTWNGLTIGSTGTSITGTANYITKFATANTLGNSLIFDNGTNVGIGTTGSNYKLEISTGINKNIYFTDMGTYMGSGAVNSAHNAYLPYGIDGSILTLNAATGGNVGIGTTNPLAKLTFANNIATGFLDNFSEYQAMLYTNATAGSSYGFGIKNNTLVLNSGNGAYSFDRSGTDTSLYLNTVGNVGIGTTNPSTKLTIKQISDTGIDSTPFQIQAPTNDTALFMGYRGAGAAFAKDTLGIVAGYTTTGAYKPLTFSTNDIERFRIAVNGNVGIGTTNPSQKLVVSGVGTTARTQILITSDGDSGAYGDYAITAGSTGGIANGNPNNFTLSFRKDGYFSGGGTAPSLELYATRVGYTGNAFYYAPFIVKGNGDLILGGADTARATNGDVGIGTTNPLYKFTVAGDEFISGRSTIGLGTTNPLYALNVGGTASFANIFASGNVGLGTTSPGSKLEVIGTSGDTVTNGILKVSTGVGTSDVGIKFGAILGSGSTGYAYIQSIHYGVGNDGNLVFNPAGGNVGIGATSPKYKLEVAGDALVSTRLGIGSTNALYALNVGGTASFANIFASGRVGVGTTNPLNTLHIEGTGGGTAGIYVNSAVPSAVTNTLYNNGGTLMWNGLAVGTSGGSISVGTSGFLSKYTTNSTLGNSVMFETSAGLIGIGTSAPKYKLEVAGDALVSTRLGIGSTNALYALNVGGTASMFNLFANGNVGIGTTAPKYKLEVAGDALISTRLGIGSTNALYALNVGGTASFANFFTSGNVGLGTTNPLYKFTVSGDEFISGRSTIGVGTTNPLYALNVGGTSNFANLFTSGNVGIGITAPSEKLVVGAAGSGSRYILMPYTTGETVGLRFGDSFNSLTNVYAGDMTMKAYHGIVLMGSSNSGSASNPYFQIKHFNTTDFAISLSGDALISTRLGIGSTNALYALNVGGTASFANFFTSGNVGLGTTNPLYKFTVSGDEFISGRSTIGVGTTNPLYALNVGGTSNFANLFASSRVGIGTTNPLNTLHIEGTGGGTAGIYLNSAVPSAVTNTLYNNGGTLMWNGLSVGTSGGSISVGTSGFLSKYTSTNTLGNSVLFESNAGLIGIGTSTPNYKLEVSGDALVSTRLGIGSTNALYALNVGGTSNFANLFASSRVGIGTTGPGALLHINGATNATTILAQLGVINIPVLNFGYSLGTAAGNSPATINTDSSSRPISLATNGGSVGIGTTSPKYKLEIVGDALVSTRLGIGSTNALYALNVGGTSNFANLFASGNVGLGTTSPLAKLDVRGAIYIGTTGTPSTPTNLLYNQGGNLYWNGSALAVGVTGAAVVNGTPNTLARFTSSNVLGDSLITDNGTVVTANNQLIITNTNIQLAGQSVAPGTTAPGSIYYDNNSNNLFLMTGDNNYHRLSLDMTKYSTGSTAVAAGSYIEIAHNQNTTDLNAAAWFYNTITSQWENADKQAVTVLQNLQNQFDNVLADNKSRTQTALTNVSLTQNVYTGTGSDGAITVSTNTNINDSSLTTGRVCVDGGDAVNYSVTALTANTATVEDIPSTGCLNPGDEVLLINLRGTNTNMDNTGNWETLRVAGVSGNVVTFMTAKTKFYGDGTNSDDTNIGLATGNQAVMLQRVPNYTNVTVNSGITFSPDAWVSPTGAINNGAGEGGVMFFRANGTVTITGTGIINANGLGYFGATQSGVTGSGTGNGSAGGEAFCGSGGTGKNGATAATNGAAGGGGTIPGIGFCGGGGGGGPTTGTGGAGSASRGGAGGGAGGDTDGGIGGGGGAGYGDIGYAGKSYSTTSPSTDGNTNSSGKGGNSYGGGGGGGTYGDANLNQLFFGSGGGKGGPYTSAGANGGNGGGIVYIAGNSININGTISSNGNNSTSTGTAAYHASGGGGAGGSIKIIGNIVNLGPTKVTAIGGTAPTAYASATGGNGGAGRVAVQYITSVSGSSTPAASTALSGYNTYGTYTSAVLETPNAANLGNLRWDSTLNTYGKISFQTRTGNTPDPSGNIWYKLDNTIPQTIDSGDTPAIGNGRLGLGASGKGDSVITRESSILYDSGTYKMWYSGSDGTNYRIYYATSPDGLTWTKVNNTTPAVCDSGSPCSGDGQVGIGSPGKGDDSRIDGPSVIKDGSIYKMWYSGFDGTSWRIFYATSPDGLTWTKFDNSIPTDSNTTGYSGRIPLGVGTTTGDASNAYSPTVILDGSTYKMWYSGITGTSYGIYYATSPDGLTWTKFDNLIPDASDISSTNGRLGVGTSGRGDASRVAYPTVILDGSTYKMWYSGFDESNYRIYHATSLDGLTWTKFDNSTPTASNIAGNNHRLPISSLANNIDSLYAYAPSVIKEGTTYRMWYTGANNVTNAQIAYAYQYSDNSSWEAWKPYTSGTNQTMLESADTHSNWIGTNLTVAEGDITRSVYNFEDENEFTATNLTKLTSSTNGGYAEADISPTNLGNYDYVSFWIRASQPANTITIGLGQSSATEQTENITIDTANVWQKVYWDISDIPLAQRTGITKLRITSTTAATNTIYFDNIRAEHLIDTTNTPIVSTPQSYLQYRVLFTTTNTNYMPQLNNVTFTYNNGYKIVQTDADHVRLYNFTGSTQNIKLEATVYGADLAEWYSITDSAIESGDVVAITGSKDSYNVPVVTKANIPGDKRLMGIISTKAGKELGIAADDRRLVALSGRVPVKIAPDSDSIYPGDLLTASSTYPGMATKASQAGFTVAKALDTWTTGSSTKQIDVFINISWFDPEVGLSDEGQITINHNIDPSVLASLGYQDSLNELQQSSNYNLVDSLGRQITTSGKFASATIGKLQAGLLQASTIITKNLIVETTKSKSLSTAVISPLSDISDTISITGNASVSGTLTAQAIGASEASFSTLYADQLNTKDGSITDVMASKINDLRTELQKTIASLAKPSSSSADLTGSSLLSQSIDWDTSAATDSAQIDSNSHLTNNLVVGSQLTVNGDTVLGNAFITGTFTTGEIAIKDNFIETVNSALYLQPSNTGSVHLMGDTLVIAENGEVTVNGNLKVTGTFTANMLVASDIQSSKANIIDLTTTKLSVATDSATIIAEPGFAQLATSSAKLTSNATAGVAVLPAGKNELIINNKNLGPNSIIYLTPAGSTGNQVVYLKSKFITPTPSVDLSATTSASAKLDSFFTIAIDQPLYQDININWWIIN